MAGLLEENCKAFPSLSSSPNASEEEIIGMERNLVGEQAG